MTSLLWEGVREGCGTCEFGLRNEFPVMQGAEPLVTISCRRFPPVLMYIEQQQSGGAPYKDVEQWTPTMRESDWCGEYKRKQPLCPPNS